MAGPSSCPRRSCPRSSTPATGWRSFAKGGWSGSTMFPRSRTSASTTWRSALLARLLQTGSSMSGVVKVAPGADERTLQLNVQGALTEIIKIAGEHNAINIDTHEPTLEEVFLRFYEPVPTGQGQALPLL